MSHAVTVQLPDNLYLALEKIALQQGKATEELGASWLIAAIEWVAGDPLLKIAGSLETGIPDLAAEHDLYISNGLISNHADENS